MPRGEFDRTARRARTRAQLLDAAARVYGEKGVDRATLDDVAEEAGFTKGAVYDHFGSKDNLLFALLDEYLTNEIADQILLFESTPDARERPQGGADRWLAHLNEDPIALRLFVEAWLLGQRDDAVRARVLEAAEAMRELFRGLGRRRAAELGELRSPLVLEGVADVFAALGLGFAMLKLIDPDRIPSELLGAAYAILAGAVDGNEDARQLIARCFD